MTNREEKSIIFYQAIMNAYRAEEDQNPVKQLTFSDDATEDFIALIYSCFVLYKRLTSDDCDIIDFTHIMNKLIVQDLLDSNGASEETT